MFAWDIKVLKCPPSHFRVITFCQTFHINKFNKFFMLLTGPASSTNIGSQRKNHPLFHETIRWKSDVPLTEGQLRSKRDEFWVICQYNFVCIKIPHERFFVSCDRRRRRHLRDEKRFGMH